MSFKFQKRRLAEPVQQDRKRVEIPVHFDLWMQGARTGFVYEHGPDFIKVKMDHPQVKHVVTIRGDDLNYVRWIE